MRRVALRIGFDHQLRGAAVVVSQHAAQPLTTFNVVIDLTGIFVGIDDLAFESLVVSFPVIVEKIFANSALPGVLAEEDHSIQAFGFDASYEVFLMGVQVGAIGRQSQRFDLLVPDNIAK